MLHSKSRSRLTACGTVLIGISTGHRNILFLFSDLDDTNLGDGDKKIDVGS